MCDEGNLPFGTLSMGYLGNLPFGTLSMGYLLICFLKTAFYAPGDDSPHGGILLLLCPYVCMYICPSLVKVFG